MAFGTQPQVTAQDQFGHLRSGDSIALSIKPGTGTAGAILTCTSNPVTTVSGIATFAGCRIDKAGTGYQLRATDSTSVGTGTVDSASMTVNPGAATKLGFLAQPTRGLTGGTFATQPVIAIQDANGNTVTSASATNITLTITTNPGSGSLICGGNPVATVAGIATFSLCRINSIGVGYVLTASGGSLTNATSLPFDVSDRLAFATQPAGAVAGVAFTTQPVIAIQAGAANTAIHDQGTAVTLSISGSPVGVTLTCTTNPVTAVNGLAAFSGCKIDKIGTYTLLASAVGLTSATSASLAVTVGPATKLGFVTQPSSGTVTQAFPAQPVVAVQDAGGNTVTTGVYSTSVVNLAILSNPGGGTLTCTSGLLRVAIAGLASFSGCSIDRTG
ncbi:MAG TPA: hypothetical protein VNF73_09300, partial [Candidatus Saccharimonadales bacterium]|nr:hypothetical protein [Candidatus Saccharimonadales bacterium]